MFKSVFSRYLISFVLIFVLSFLCFGGIIYGYVSDYAKGEAISSVRTASYSAKIMLDKMYENYFSGGENRTYAGFFSQNRDEIKASLGGYSTFTDVEILVLNAENEVIAVATKGDLLGVRLADDFYKGEFTSKKKTAVEGLDAEKIYYSTIALSGSERFYVLVYNTIDTEAEILAQLLKALFASAMVVFLFGFAACYIISVRMIAPLRDMSIAAKKFALGDFSARVEVKGEDEIAELATAFNGMAQSLGELEEQRSTFLANISHDLRTPMTSISGFIDGILDGTIKESEQKRYLEIVSTEIKRLSRLVRTLLEVSKIDAGVRKFNMIDFDVAEMAIMILFSFENQIDSKKLNVDFDSEEHMYVKADKDAIHQVLYNLIDNAVKFSKEQGTLRISVKKSDKSVKIEVYNEGAGIPKEDLPYVFDRFYKADKSRGLDKGGTGLGLFISKAIVQAHGEMLCVESEQGQFCKFYFTLPIGTVTKKAKNKE